MHADIDKLNIEITDNADKASKNIDKLAQTLEKLKKAVKNTGLDKLSEQLKKLKETSLQMSGIDTYVEKINKFQESIHKLSGMKIPSVTKLNNRIKQLMNMTREMSSFSGVGQFSENINQICSAMKPMENMGKNTFGSHVKALKEIVEVSKSIDTTNLEKFKNFIKELTSSIQPLTSEVSKSEKGLVSLNKIIQSTVSSNGNLASSNAATVKSYTSLSSILTNAKVKLTVYGYALLRVVKAMKGWVDLSNSYIEDMNLFSVAMGKEADSAFKYAQSVNNALGIDTGEWIRNQGTFKQVTSGFGVVENKANLMSKNLTQLGYDISSFFNINVDEAMQKLQSGLSGEIMPLRSIGYALDEATLKQVAYANGITMNVSKMTQAQKSQLRYIAILQQSKNVMGDMARTVTTPANAMRILDQQITQLKRSLGNILSLVVQKLLPYIQAFVKLLGEAADYLAKKWGFELPKIDYSNVGQQFSGISDEADNTTKSVKKTVKEMQRLAGFDEINTLSSNDNSNSTDDNSANNNSDLGLELPQYDFLSDTESQVEEIYKKMKDKLKELKKKFQDLATWIEKNKGLVKGLAGLLAGLWALNKVKKFMNALGGLSIFQTAKKWLRDFINGFKSEKGVTFFQKLKNGVKGFRNGLTPAQKALGTIVGTVMASYGSYNLFNNLAKGTLDWKTALCDTALIIGGIGTAALFGGPVGAAVATLGVAIAAVIGQINGTHDALLEMDKVAIENELFNNGGTKINELTDAFGKQFNKLKDLNTKLQDYDSKIEDNRISIDDYKTTVDEYAKKIDGTGKLAQDELGPMKTAVEDLAGALKEAIDLDCSKFFKIVKDSISDVAEQVGIDVGNMTTAITEFKSKVSGKIGQSESAVTNYLDKWGSSGKPQYKEGDDVQSYKDKLAEYKKGKKAYEDAMNYLNGMATEITQAKSNFQNAINDVNTVDFRDEYATKEALSDLKKYASEAKKDAKEIYQSSLNTYDNLMQDLEYNKKMGVIKGGDYKRYKKQFEDFRKGAKVAYDNNLKDINNQLKNTTQKIYDSANESVYDRIKTVPNVESHSKKWAEDRIKNEKDTLGYLYSGIEEITKDNNLKLNEKAKENFLESFESNGSDVKSRVLDFTQDQFEDYNRLINETSEANLDSTNAKAISKIQELIGDDKKDIAKWISNDNKEIISSSGKLGEDSGNEFIRRYQNAISQVQLAAQAGANIVLSVIPGNKTKISGYATGGYPTKAQLFYAREDGKPEMVGKIGNQTAVANNEQITEGIANAVYKAAISVMNSRIATGGETKVTHVTKVYLAEREIGQAVDEYQNRQSVRSGGRR